MQKKVQNSVIIAPVTAVRDRKKSRKDLHFSDWTV